MQNDAIDDADLSRMADDGCPHAITDTNSSEFTELWNSLGKEDYAAR
jgi:hypothetical protein